MKSLSDYKRQARIAARRDTADGFKYHCINSPFSERESALTGQMCEDGFNVREVELVSEEWECAL